MREISVDPKDMALPQSSDRVAFTASQRKGRGIISVVVEGGALKVVRHEINRPATFYMQDDVFIMTRLTNHKEESMELETWSRSRISTFGMSYFVAQITHFWTVFIILFSLWCWWLRELVRMIPMLKTSSLIPLILPCFELSTPLWCKGLPRLLPHQTFMDALKSPIQVLVLVFL